MTSSRPCLPLPSVRELFPGMCSARASSAALSLLSPGFPLPGVRVPGTCSARESSSAALSSLLLRPPSPRSTNSFQVCARHVHHHLLPSHRLQTYAVELFRPQPMVTPQTSSPSASTHDSQEPTPYDESSISLFSLISLSSDRSQATNLPSTSISHHLQVPPSDQSTVQGTAIDTTDHQYTRARFDVPHVGEGRYEVDVHITQRWPDVVGNTPTSHMSTRSTSPEVFSPHSQSSQQVEHRVGPSGLPDNEQASSPMTSSPHVAFNPTITNLIDFAPQPTSSKQRSVKTHSGKRRYRCDVCDSGWGRPSSLTMHMVSHSGVKGAHVLVNFSGLQLA